MADRVAVFSDVGPTVASQGRGQENEAQSIAAAMDAALTTNFATGMVGLVMGTSTLGLTWFVSRDVPVNYMAVWVAISAALMIFWVGATAWLLFFGKIRHPLHVWMWARVVAGMLIVGNGLLILSVWMFFPYLEYEQRLTIAILHAALIPAQIVCCPGNIIVNRTATVVMFGTLILFFARIDGSRATAVIVFLVALMGMMLVASGFVRGRLRDAVHLRVASDALSRRLEDALRSVTGARDAKARFIAAASHDLGQPIQAAALFFDQAMLATTPAERERTANGVRRAFATADTIITEMLDFMRLEADAVGAVFARTQLGPLLVRLAAQCGPAAAARGAELRVVHTSQAIVTDSSLVERAMANLIGNAIRHSNCTRILIGARRAGSGTIRLYVIDDGRGIDPGDRDHLFEDYYRGVNNDGERGGFGLGLASVRRIVGLLGGVAGVDPRWSNGSAFYLQLPSHEADYIE